MKRLTKKQLVHLACRLHIVQMHQKAFWDSLLELEEELGEDCDANWDYNDLSLEALIECAKPK